ADMPPRGNHPRPVGRLSQSSRAGSGAGLLDPAAEGRATHRPGSSCASGDPARERTADPSPLTPPACHAAFFGGNHTMRLPESVLPEGTWASAALVQVTMIALLGCLAWLASRRGGPALRGAIVLATLIGVLVAPVVASVAPVWLPLPEWVCLAGAE